MGKSLNCDETEEIRTIMKHIYEIIEEAEWDEESGNGDELSRLVVRYLPIIEQSYKNFIERSVLE